MDDQRLPDQFPVRAAITIPPFHEIPQITLDLSKIKYAESRLSESQVVNPGTYGELEFVFNEGYREGRTHLSIVGYQLSLAKKALKQAHSEAIIERYSDFLKDRNFKDSASMREAFLETQKDYTDAQDRIDMLVAIESFVKGKIDTFENTCRYMKKEIDITLRSGFSNNKY